MSDQSHVIKPKDPLDELENPAEIAMEREAKSSSRVAGNAPDRSAEVAKPDFWAPIKQEYLVPWQGTKAEKAKEEEKAKEASSSLDEAIEERDPICPPPEKKKMMSKHAERKAKVQRPIGAEFATMCHAIAASEPCQRGAECKWSHDLKGFLASQPEALDGECPSFRRFGRCRYGLVCRFRKDHSTTGPDGELVNIADHDKWNAHLAACLSKLPKDIDVKNFEQVKMAWNWNPDETNHISKELASSLKKRSYTFIKSVLAQHQIQTKQNSPNRSYVILPKDRSDSKLDLRGKLILAPLTTIGNLPFRRICKRFGADVTIGEMALTNQLLQGTPQEWALVHRHESEDIFGVQIAGCHVDQVTSAVEVINKHMSVDFIDLNCGCPVDLVCQQGMGSALLTRLTRLEDLVTAMSQTSQVPITVKVRIGRDWDHPITHSQIAPVVHQWGASALTVHGRSKEQRYRNEANWDYIEKCADACKLPLIGNGDVYNFEEAEAHLASGKVSSLMLARGAITKPWLFTEIKERRHWDISSSERFDILKEFTHNGLEHWGSDAQGVEKTRYFLLNWMSLLSRYIPVGLLERVPIRIGQKAPQFIGRNDLETLMGSSKIDDMISISSMLLGPPPANFKFEPKHKAGG
jgi:tRNA-dihydrouridine synthase 3